MLTAAGQADARVTSGGRRFVDHAATIEPLLHPGFVKPKEKSRSPVDVPVRWLSFRERTTSASEPSPGSRPTLQGECRSHHQGR